MQDYNREIAEEKHRQILSRVMSIKKPGGGNIADDRVLVVQSSDQTFGKRLGVVGSVSPGAGRNVVKHCMLI